MSGLFGSTNRAFQPRIRKAVSSMFQVCDPFLPHYPLNLLTVIAHYEYASALLLGASVFVCDTRDFAQEIALTIGDQPQDGQNERGNLQLPQSSVDKHTR